jgi:hypothetical protein
MPAQKLLPGRPMPNDHENEQPVKPIAITILILFLFLPLPTPAAEKHDDAEKQAAAAESWLALVDDGKYAESWDAAAEYLKNAVSKDDFVKSLNAARKPLGKAKSREVKSKEYQTSLPGAPDGEYVVIQFKTSLENKKSAVETVTPMMDKDKKWRVSGYYIPKPVKTPAPWYCPNCLKEIEAAKAEATD